MEPRVRAILADGDPRNIYLKLFKNPSSRLGGEIVLKLFFFFFFFFFFFVIIFSSSGHVVQRSATV